MDTALLTTKFTRIGARLQIADRLDRRFRDWNGRLSLDIRSDREGEFFEVFLPSKVEVNVLDTQPKDRHLLLLIRDQREKQKFLCGHDERHWFVAAIPEKAPVGTVRQAKEALKPPEVQVAQSQKRLRGKSLDRRKNIAFIRQGEWFFLPMTRLSVDKKLILRHEPIRRGNGGKPHWADFAYRVGGETVYVCPAYPNGLTEAERTALLRRDPSAKFIGWRPMVRNPSLYVRGRIRHPDHKTIMLHDWHQVVMNTENQAKAMQNVAFLD